VTCRASCGARRARLEAYGWPGTIRALPNVSERGVIMVLAGAAVPEAAPRWPEPMVGHPQRMPDQRRASWAMLFGPGPVLHLMLVIVVAFVVVVIMRVRIIVMVLGVTMLGVVMVELGVMLLGEMALAGVLLRMVLLGEVLLGEMPLGEVLLRKVLLGEVLLGQVLIEEMALGMMRRAMFRVLVMGILVFLLLVHDRSPWCWRFGRRPLPRMWRVAGGTFRDGHASMQRLIGPGSCAIMAINAQPRMSTPATPRKIGRFMGVTAKANRILALSGTAEFPEKIA